MWPQCQQATWCMIWEWHTRSWAHGARSHAALGLQRPPPFFMTTSFLHSRLPSPFNPYPWKKPSQLCPSKWHPFPGAPRAPVNGTKHSLSCLPWSHLLSLDEPPECLVSAHLLSLPLLVQWSVWDSCSKHKPVGTLQSLFTNWSEDWTPTGYTHNPKWEEIKKQISHTEKMARMEKIMNSDSSIYFHASKTFISKTVFFRKDSCPNSQYWFLS